MATLVDVASGRPYATSNRGAEPVDLIFHVQQPTQDRAHALAHPRGEVHAVQVLPQGAVIVLAAGTYGLGDPVNHNRP